MTNVVDQLRPCPCGKTPERLIVHAEHSCPKWAWVTGSCCDGSRRASAMECRRGARVDAGAAG